MKKILLVAMFATLAIQSSAEAHRRIKKTPKPVQIVQQQPKSFFDLFTTQAQPIITDNTSKRNDKVVTINLPVTTVTTGPIEKAKQFIGVNDHSGRSTLIKLFNDTLNMHIDPRSTMWCAAFANSILSENKIQGTNSLKADSFSSWGKGTQAPKSGDIVLLKLRGGNHVSHVSFYVATIDSPIGKCVQALGGNQSHEVKYSCYPVSKVAGYRTES